MNKTCCFPGNHMLASPTNMARKKRNRDKSTVEWERKNDNIGVIWTFPGLVLKEYLTGKDIVIDIIRLFWDRNNRKISLLDFCVLSSCWWWDESILAARMSLYTHPDHHFSQYTFDKKYERLIIEFRQPDIDGEHWKYSHIHIIRGEINPSDFCKINNTFFSEHIWLQRPKINEYYVTKVK